MFRGENNPFFYFLSFFLFFAFIAYFILSFCLENFCKTIKHSARERVYLYCYQENNAAI